MLGRIRAKRGIGEQVWFVPNAAGGLGAVQPQENFAILTLLN